MFPRITHDPAVLSGKPCVRGTRLSVEFILELIASGGTPNEIIGKYPQLARVDIEEAVRYAAFVLKSSAVIQTRAAG